MNFRNKAKMNLEPKLGFYFDWSGFISIDCGLEEDSMYTDEKTKITYVSDGAFVGGGESKVVSPEYTLNKQQYLVTLKSFPNENRHCYTINTAQGTLYLIRATFLYGNYDAKNSPPKFDLHLGPNLWDTVEFVDAATPEVKEIIHAPARNFVRVCLANTGFGTPFISALELRPIKNNTYQYEPSESLRLFVRYDVGSTTNESYR